MSIGQWLEKGYSLIFKDKTFVIYNHTGCELHAIEMKEKCFSLDLKEANKGACVSTIQDTTLKS